MKEVVTSAEVQNGGGVRGDVAVITWHLSRSSPEGWRSIVILVHQKVRCGRKCHKYLTSAVAKAPYGMPWRRCTEFTCIVQHIFDLYYNTFPYS